MAAIASGHGGETDQLCADLAELRYVVEHRGSRLVTYDHVGELQVWLTGRDGWSLVEPLRRLGRAGVLSAAGAVACG